MVGLTEKEAKEKGISYETATFPWAASGRAIASDCADGMTKLIFDKESHRVIGGAIVGTNGGELLVKSVWQSKWVVMLKTSH